MNILTTEQTREMAPAIFSKQPASKMSDRYSFIETAPIIEEFAKQNWFPTKVGQRKSKKYDNTKIKHMVALSNPDFQPVMQDVGSLSPQIVLLNSHNGTSSLSMRLGLFRLVCSNGLIIADSQFAQMKRRHSNINQEEITSIIYDATHEFNDVWSKLDEYKSIKLTNGQRLDFATKSIEMNWGKDSVIEPHMLLKTRRDEDNSDDLFTSMNIIQENIIQGGVEYNNRRTARPRKSRAIKDSMRDIKINTFLWSTMEYFRVNKTFK